MIAEIVGATGWTWDEALDTLTMPRFLALRAHWRTRPPAHWLLAAALKYSPPDETAPTARQPSVGELRVAFPGGRL